MTRTSWLGLFTFLFFSLLIASGIYVIWVSELAPVPTPATGEVTGLPKVIFALHLVLWMILGMMSNYVWDLFRDGKAWSDITWRGLLLPVFVSPIVFFSIWSLWKNQAINFAWPLISFQNGFFWQVVFSKAGPK